MKKYRYIMNGTFSPEVYVNTYEDTMPDHLNIDIPAPFVRDSEEEAMQDGGLAYRFISDGEKVLIAVYPKEIWEPATDEEGRKCINVWTVGRPIYLYSYEEFKNLGGMMHEFPNSLHFCDEYKIDISFNELFPSLQKDDKPVYIDNEAYIVREEV